MKYEEHKKQDELLYFGYAGALRLFLQEDQIEGTCHNLA